MKDDHDKMKGFTLMELLIVVVIIGILASVILPNFIGRTEQARRTQARTEIESTLALALDMFAADTGFHPSSEQGLAILISAPEEMTSWQGPYVAQKTLRDFTDPWGRPYQYESPGQNNIQSYDLWSFGKDGQAGTEDDIKNFRTD